MYEMHEIHDTAGSKIYSASDANDFRQKIPRLVRSYANVELIFLFDCFFGIGLETLYEKLTSARPASVNVSDTNSSALHIILVNTFDNSDCRLAQQNICKRHSNIHSFDVFLDSGKKAAAKPSLEDSTKHIKKMSCLALDFFLPTSFDFIYYNYYSAKHTKHYSKLKDELRAYLSNSSRNHLTSHYFGKLWLQNIAQNLRKTEQHRNKAAISMFEALASSFSLSGIPFVLGAGPSLNDETAKFICTHRDKLVLFCADSSLPFLYSHAIVPDICCVLEAQQANIADFLIPPAVNWSSVHFRKTHYIIDLCAHPSTVDAVLSIQNSLRTKTKGIKQDWEGGEKPPVYFFLSSFVKSTLFEHADLRKLSIPALGSVGILALYLAIAAGANTITYAGLDFSYFTGLSHAHMTGGHSAYLVNNTKLSALAPMPAHSIVCESMQHPDPKIEYSSHTQKNSLPTIMRISDATLLSYARLVEKIQGLYSHTEFFDLNSDPVIDTAKTITLQDLKIICDKAKKASIAIHASNKDSSDIKKAIVQVLSSELELLQDTQNPRQDTQNPRQDTQNPRQDTQNPRQDTQKDHFSGQNKAMPLTIESITKAPILSLLSLGTFLKPYQLLAIQKLSNEQKKRMIYLGTRLQKIYSEVLSTDKRAF